MKREKLDNLIINTNALVKLLDTWVANHSDCTFRLKMATTNLPSIRALEDKACGTSACHAGWMFAILAGTDGPNTVDPFTSQVEDNYAAEEWEKLISIERNNEDYLVGISLLARFLGFSSDGEFKQFFYTYAFITGHYDPSDLFGCATFWTENEEFCKILNEKEITEKEDLRIVAEWWRYILTVLNNLKEILSGAEVELDCPFRQIAQVLSAASLLSPYVIHTLIFKNEEKYLMDQFITPLVDKIRSNFTKHFEPNQA